MNPIRAVVCVELNVWTIENLRLYDLFLFEALVQDLIDYRYFSLEHSNVEHLIRMMEINDEAEVTLKYGAKALTELFHDEIVRYNAEN